MATYFRPLPAILICALLLGCGTPSGGVREEIKQNRETSRVSQAVFAALLNTSVSTMQKWEIGQKRPTGTALKLLHLVKSKGLESIA